MEDKQYLDEAGLGEVGKVISKFYASKEEVKNIDVTKQLNDYAKKTDLDNKVDKVDGKFLSSNDYTDADKAKLDNIDLSKILPSINDIQTLKDKLSNNPSIAIKHYTVESYDKESSDLSYDPVALFEESIAFVYFTITNNEDDSQLFRDSNIITFSSESLLTPAIVVSFPWVSMYGNKNQKVRFQYAYSLVDKNVLSRVCCHIFGDDYSYFDTIQGWTVEIPSAVQEQFDVTNRTMGILKEHIPTYRLDSRDESPSITSEYAIASTSPKIIDVTNLSNWLNWALDSNLKSSIVRNQLSEQNTKSLRTGVCWAEYTPVSNENGNKQLMKQVIFLSELGVEISRQSKEPLDVSNITGEIKAGKSFINFSDATKWKMGNLWTPWVAKILNTHPIVNNLTDGGNNIPLSAEQGKILSDKVLMLQQELQQLKNQIKE